MNRVNLIPVEVQDRTARVARGRSWGVLLGGFGLCLALVGAAVRVGLSTQTADLTRQISDAESGLQRVTDEQNRVKTQLTSIKRRLDAARATGRHPNWGLLLNMLAASLDEQTALDGVELSRMVPEPVKAEAGKKAPKPVAEQVVILRGRSTNMEAMGGFLANLEKSHLFRLVKLGDNHRSDSAGKNVIEFQVTCVLDSSALPTTEAK